MENRFEGAEERIETLEEMAPSRLRLVATLIVILVTAATVVATVLSAMASSNAAIADRNRQEFEAHATTDGLIAAQESTAGSQQRDDTTEAAWRNLLLTQVASEATDPTVSRQLLAQAKIVAIQRGVLARAEPAPSDAAFTLYLEKVAVAATTDEQTAQAYAAQNSGWSGREAGDLATISMLAVALFLLGLALTLTSRRSATGFVTLALVLLMVGAGRLVLLEASPVRAPSASAIASYVQGTEQAYKISYGNLSYAAYMAEAARARASFTRALTISPGYAVAWEALGNLTVTLATTPRQYAPAVTQLRNAIADGHPFPTLYNDVGYAQILSKNIPGAMATLRQALALDPTNVITLASLAEARVSAGDLRGAASYLDRALHQVARYGPNYQLTYFENFRSNESFLRTVSPAAVVDKFWTMVKNAEVRLSLYGSTTPGTAHGAKVSNIAVRPLGGVAGHHGGSSVTFDYTGLRAGDVVAARWYEYGDTYEPAASTVLSVPSNLAAGDGALAVTAGVDPLLVPSKQQTLEIYVDGVLVASHDYTPPGTAVN